MAHKMRTHSNGGGGVLMIMMGGQRESTARKPPQVEPIPDRGTSDYFEHATND